MGSLVPGSSIQCHNGDMYRIGIPDIKVDRHETTVTAANTRTCLLPLHFRPLHGWKMNKVELGGTFFLQRVVAAKNALSEINKIQQRFTVVRGRDNQVSLPFPHVLDPGVGGQSDAFPTPARPGRRGVPPPVKRGFHATHLWTELHLKVGDNVLRAIRPVPDQA